MLFYWTGCALAISGLLLLLGRRGPRRNVLTDQRGRFSLTNLQVLLWTVIITSLLAGTVLGRAVVGASPLALKVPQQLLAIMGIHLVVAVVSTGLKVWKDGSRPESVAASDPNDRPRVAQVLMVEEGEMADLAVDLTKLQSLLLNSIVAAAYLVSCVTESLRQDDLAILVLPRLPDAFVLLVGMGAAAHLLGKVPARGGEPRGLSVKLRILGARPSNNAGDVPDKPTPEYIPRRT